MCLPSSIYDRCGLNSKSIKLPYVTCLYANGHYASFPAIIPISNQSVCSYCLVNLGEL